MAMSSLVPGVLFKNTGLNQSHTPTEITATPDEIKTKYNRYLVTFFVFMVYIGIFVPSSPSYFDIKEHSIPITQIVYCVSYTKSMTVFFDGQAAWPIKGGATSSTNSLCAPTPNRMKLIAKCYNSIKFAVWAFMDQRFWLDLLYVHIYQHVLLKLHSLSNVWLISFVKGVGSYMLKHKLLWNYILAIQRLLFYTKPENIIQVTIST